MHKAEPLKAQVIETCKKKLGADHPSTRISMANLAFTWKSQGRRGGCCLNEAVCVAASASAKG